MIAFEFCDIEICDTLIAFVKMNDSDVGTQKEIVGSENDSADIEMSSSNNGEKLGSGDCGPAGTQSPSMGERTPQYGIIRHEELGIERTAMTSIEPGEIYYLIILILTKIIRQARRYIQDRLGTDFGKLMRRYLGRRDFKCAKNIKKRLSKIL